MISSAEGNWSRTVPILLTSAVDGSGVGRMHAFIRHLPIPTTPSARDISLGRESSQPVPPATVFDVDEVFEIPLSKVYSQSSERTRTRRHGVVLCGLVRYGAVAIGDELLIGPVAVELQGDRPAARPAQRSRSEQFSKTPPPPEPLRTRPASGEFPFPSYPTGSHSPKPSIATQYQWQRVRVVSVRNLRLPVRQLLTDQVGTVGVEPTVPTPDGEPPHLGKIRKGMVLVSCPSSSSSSSSGPPLYSGFVASFPANEISSIVSPPLLLGGNATAYVANVRTTVRVTSVTLPGNEMISHPSSPTEPEFFRFDGDAVDRNGHAAATTTGTAGARTITRSAQGTANAGISNAIDAGSKENVTISFSFVTSAEWIEVGSRVFLMPAASVTTPSTCGGSSSTLLTGLEGFVGRVCAVLPVEPP